MLAYSGENLRRSSAETSNPLARCTRDDEVRGLSGSCTSVAAGVVVPIGFAILQGHVGHSFYRSFQAVFRVLWVPRGLAGFLNDL